MLYNVLDIKTRNMCTWICFAQGKLFSICYINESEPSFIDNLVISPHSDIFGCSNKLTTSIHQSSIINFLLSFHVFLKALLHTACKKWISIRDSFKGLYQVIILEIDSWVPTSEFKWTLLRQFSDCPGDWIMISRNHFSPKAEDFKKTYPEE